MTGWCFPVSMKAEFRQETVLKRFFVTLPEPVTQFPSQVVLNDRDLCHYLQTVIRARSGERLVIVDDLREMALEAVIQSLEKSTVAFSVERALETPPATLPYVTLAVALIKEQRWDWLLQKATELGVRCIQPLISERTVVKLSGGDAAKKLTRWQAVLRSAAEQSEGLFIPQILSPMTVKEFCDGNQPGFFRILLRERGGDRLSLKALLPTVHHGQALVMAIGPEGGWTDAEMITFSHAGFVGASLGDRILRSETAAIAAMSAVVYQTAE